MGENKVDMISLHFMPMEVECRTNLSALTFVAHMMIQTSKPQVFQLAHAIGMIPGPARLVPDRVAVEIACNDSAWPQRRLVCLEIVPELADIAQIGGHGLLRPDT